MLVGMHNDYGDLCQQNCAVVSFSSFFFQMNVTGVLFDLHDP